MKKQPLTQRSSSTVRKKTVSACGNVDAHSLPAAGTDSGDIPPSKYHRKIKGVWIDVYDILYAYGVTNPGDQHAIKKMIMPGQRGDKSARQDREESIMSIYRAIGLEG